MYQLLSFVWGLDVDSVTLSLSKGIKIFFVLFSWYFGLTQYKLQRTKKSSTKSKCKIFFSHKADTYPVPNYFTFRTFRAHPTALVYYYLFLHRIYVQGNFDGFVFTVHFKMIFDFHNELARFFGRNVSLHLEHNVFMVNVFYAGNERKLRT